MLFIFCIFYYFQIKFLLTFHILLIHTKIGNDAIHQLTNRSPQILRVSLQRFSGEKGNAEYYRFAVGDENSKYKLTISGYSGNIG